MGVEREIQPPLFGGAVALGSAGRPAENSNTSGPRVTVLQARAADPTSLGGRRKSIRTQRWPCQTGYDQPPLMLLFVLCAYLRLLIDLSERQCRFWGGGGQSAFAAPRSLRAHPT